MRRFSDSPGSIYPALGRLQRRRWVHATRDAASRRQRTVYSLTVIGRKVLREWLMVDADRLDVVPRLDELLLRLSFQHVLDDPAAVRRFLNTLAAIAADGARRLRQYLRTSTTTYPAGAILALEAGLNTYESLSRWAALEAKRARPRARRRS